MTRPVFPRSGARTLLALGAALTVPGLPVALAAESATPLPPVQVDSTTEPEATLGTTTLDAEAIARKRAFTADTAQLLKDIPGLSLYSAGGVSSLPVLHGMADDRVKVEVNGMEITAACPNHMNPSLSYIDPARVGTAMVVAGITPVSLGGDSIAGTIIVNSPDPVFATAGQGLRTGGTLSSVFRSNNRAITASGDVSAATENYSIGYNGSWTQASDGHRGGDDKPIQTSKFQTENHAITIGARQGDHLLVAEAGFQFIPYEGFPNQRMDLTENKGGFANLRYQGLFGWGKLETKAFWHAVAHEMNFLDKVKGSNMPMNTEATEAGYSVKADIALSPDDTLRIGNEFRYYALQDWWPPTSTTPNGGMSPFDFINIHEGRRDRLGSFAEWEAKWNEKWTSLVGIRNDIVMMDAGNVHGYSRNATYAADADLFNATKHAKTDVNIDATVLARYEADRASTYEGGYARKTRSPSLYERYTWSTGTMASNMNNWTGDGNGYVGKIDLKPEVAHTASLSGDWHDPARKTWGAKLTPYYTYVQDYIDADRYPTFTSNTTFGKLKLANHEANLYGLDLSGNLEAWESDAAGRGVVKATLGYVKGWNRDTGNNLYNVMPLNARFALEHKLGGWGNAVDLQMVNGKSEVATNRNELKTPGYAVVNLATSYTWENLTGSLGIENLFDKLYYQPLGGVDLSDTGKTLRYNVPGTGRSYVGGVTVKF